MPKYTVTFTYDTDRLPTSSEANPLRPPRTVEHWRDRLCARWSGIDPRSIDVQESAR
jgi:hypothetical protein